MIDNYWKEFYEYIWIDYILDITHYDLCQYTWKDFVYWFPPSIRSQKKYLEFLNKVFAEILEKHLENYLENLHFEQTKIEKIYSILKEEFQPQKRFDFRTHKFSKENKDFIKEIFINNKFLTLEDEIEATRKLIKNYLHLSSIHRSEPIYNITSKGESSKSS
jgi:hypothetical protein